MNRSGPILRGPTRFSKEADYQELKQELGLGDYEGRGWRGFHHHATLCIAAYGFPIAERGAIPPSGPGFSAPLSGSAIPEGYRPRGTADPTRTPHPQLDRHHAATPHRRTRQDSPEMPRCNAPIRKQQEFRITFDRIFLDVGHDHVRTSLRECCRNAEANAGSSAGLTQ
jgi:hypothetical protein